MEGSGDAGAINSIGLITKYSSKSKKKKSNIDKVFKQRNIIPKEVLKLFNGGKD